MTAARLTALAALGSAALMIAALAFQHIGGMAPCKMCIWQRYPHVVAILLGLAALTFRKNVLLLLGAAAAATTAAIGYYHAGVEQGWWQGPSTCSAGTIDGMSADALLDQIMSAPLVRCDDIPWELFGISMAGWNALVSSGLAALWIMAYRRA
ncbi:MAG: disulfide bond formation protein B [Roseobacter sp.]|jgi:disulfide bond formation protein DsbB